MEMISRQDWMAHTLISKNGKADVLSTSCVLLSGFLPGTLDLKTAGKAAWSDVAAVVAVVR